MAIINNLYQIWSTPFMWEELGWGNRLLSEKSGSDNNGIFWKCWHFCKTIIGYNFGAFSSMFTKKPSNYLPHSIFKNLILNESLIIKTNIFSLSHWNIKSSKLSILIKFNEQFSAIHLIWYWIGYLGLTAAITFLQSFFHMGKMKPW